MRPSTSATSERGAALVIALTLLVIISLLAISSMRSSTMELRIGANFQQVERLSQGADNLMAEAFADSNRVTLQGNQLDIGATDRSETLAIATTLPAFSDCDPQGSTVVEALIGRGYPVAYGVDFTGVHVELRSTCAAVDASANAKDALVQPTSTAYSGAYREANSNPGHFISSD